MSVQLLNSKAIVVARHINPALVSQHWLARNQIVGEEDLRENCVFTNMIAQVYNHDFTLLVTPDQLQFSPHGDRTQAQASINEKFARVIQHLPGITYVAAGLNFLWKVQTRSDEITRLSRSMFFVPESPLHRAFDEPTATFGGYMSKDTLGCRLNLEVKPEAFAGENSQASAFFLAFNYQIDLTKGTNPIEEIRLLLDRWEAAREQSGLMTRMVALEPSQGQPSLCPLDVPIATFYTPLEYPWTEAEYEVELALKELIESYHANH